MDVTSQDIEIIDHLDDLASDFNIVLGTSRKLLCNILIKNGEITYKLNFPVRLKALLERVKQVEKMYNGILDLLIRRGFEKEDKTDYWHVDGWRGYLYSNKQPTELLKDPNKSYASKFLEERAKFQPNVRDIYIPPECSLVRISGNTIHRTPADISVDRFLINVLPKPLDYNSSDSIYL